MSNSLWSKLRLDGWGNVLTGMGILNRDRSTATKPSGYLFLDQATLDNIYAGDGLGRIIIDAVAENMTREWIEVDTGDTKDSEAITARLEEIEAKSAITDLLRWSRLYGGAIAVLGVDDGGQLSEPVNEAALRSVNFIQVYDRHEVSLTSMQFYNDPTQPKYGKPQFYTVQPSSGSPFEVHESRVLRLDGDPLPRRLWQNNNYWGASVLQTCYTQLRDVATSHHAGVTIMQEFILSILKMKNLADMIGSGQESLVLQRLNILDLSKGLSNTVTIDEGEELTRVSATVSGLPDLIDRVVQHLSAVCRIPVTVLMGKAPAGLNATGDSDIRNWYDALASEQQDRLHPIMSRLVKLLLLSSTGPTGGKEPEDWRVKFRPLWQQSDGEKAATRKSIAEVDALMVDRGVLDPDEVRQNRYRPEGWSMETQVDTRAE